MNSARYQNLMQYILPLMAVSALISQSLVDLFLIICVGNWLYFFLKEKNRKEFLPYTGLEWAFGGLFVAMLLSVLVNYWGQWEYLWPVHKIKWVLEFYAMLWFLRRFGFNAEKTVKTILWVGMIPSIYAIATYFNGTDFLNPDRDTAARVVGLVNSATYHAHAGALLLGLSLFFYVQKKMYIVRANWYLVPMLMIFFASFYLTYTRGAWLAFFAGLVVFCYMQGRRAFVLFLIALILAIPSIYFVGDKFKERVNRIVDPRTMDASRWGLTTAYVDAFKEYPLFGIGYDAYKTSGSIELYTVARGVPTHLVRSHAHNQFLQIAATTGLVGVFFFVAIFVVTIGRLFRKRNKDATTYWKPVLATLVVAILLFATDQTFEYAKIRVLVVLVLSLASILSLNLIGPKYVGDSSLGEIS